MPNAQRKRAAKLGGVFGGLLGGAVKALKGKAKPSGQKGKKKKKSRQQMLDEI